MAVKLEALSDPYKSSVDLIPFSDYSRWERRPIRRPDRPNAALVQWSKQQSQAQGVEPLANLQHEFTRGEKGKVVSSTIKAKLSIRSQEPTKIKVLKVGRTLSREMHAYPGFICCRMKWEAKGDLWKHIGHMSRI